MIQDICPHHFDNTFKANSVVNDNDYIFYFKENTLLMKRTNESFTLPRKKELKGSFTEAVFLFTFNDQRCFLVWDPMSQEDEYFVFREIHFRNPFLQYELDWVTGVALQLKNWYAQNRYCGKCGSPTGPGKEERAVICPVCQSTKYPTIAPAIIVAILHEDRLLLARNTHFPEGYYSLVAGYVDVGETIEQAVKREVREEVGLQIKNISYYKSQPWPFSGSMMLGFIAELDGDPSIHVDGIEIAEAAWYKQDELPTYPANRSIAGEIIDKFKCGVSLFHSEVAL
jgi:NAD+ diphosphatase